MMFDRLKYFIKFQIYWDRTKLMTRADHHILVDGKWTPVTDVFDYNKGKHKKKGSRHKRYDIFL